MEGKRWINPYIKLISTKPQLILACVDGSPDAEERQRLQEKSSSYAKLCAEFCSGSGAHLIALAEREPDTLFLGFELRYKRAFRTAEKAECQGLQNLLVLRCNARLAIQLFEAESFDAFYVNFPDPWDRKRWKKHRLLTEAFVTDMHTLLKPNGKFSFKTDHDEYFEETLKILESKNQFSVYQSTRDLHSSHHAQSNIATEFEGLYLSKGISINYLLSDKTV